MPGFYITNCLPVTPRSFTTQPCVLERVEVDTYHVYRNTLQKFMDDKLFYCGENYAIILEAVLMNKQELVLKYGRKNLLETVEAMIQEDPLNFFDQFRGMFSGAVYIRNLKKWIVFADQIGNKAVFYYVSDGKVIIGSQLDDIAQTLQANGIDRRIDRNGAGQFLDFGCFMDDSTWLRNVRRILPGDCVEITETGAVCHTYHTFIETAGGQMSEEEAIEKIDRAFCQAVQRAINKNKEYGYTNVLDLSGGADSRMIVYTAKRLGVENAMLVHYSQSGSNEMKVALNIAHELEMPCYVNTLDDAEFMKDAEQIVQMNSGTGYYYGITGGKRVLRTLSGNKLGIEFTGLLGDVMEGAFLAEGGEIKPDLTFGRFQISNAVPLDVLRVTSLERYRTNTMFWLFARGMLCGMSTFLTRQNYVEPYTPYGDVDFMDTIQSIPFEMLTRGKIQLKWMRDRYPTAYHMTYAASGMPISMYMSKPGYFLVRAYATLAQYKDKLLGKSTSNMNPILQWEKEKSWLPQWKQEFFNDCMKKLENNRDMEPQLLEAIHTVFASGPMMQYQAISAAASCVTFAGASKSQ